MKEEELAFLGQGWFRSAWKMDVGGIPEYEEGEEEEEWSYHFVDEQHPTPEMAHHRRKFGGLTRPRGADHGTGLHAHGLMLAQHQFDRVGCCRTAVNVDQVHHPIDRLAPCLVA